MTGTIWDDVQAERDRAHQKHGDTSMESAPASDPKGRRYRILAEEVGEVAREFNDAEHDRRGVDLARVRRELVQVAAMASAWADAIDNTMGVAGDGDYAPILDEGVTLDAAVSSAANVGPREPSGPTAIDSDPEFFHGLTMWAHDWSAQVRVTDVALHLKRSDGPLSSSHELSIDKDDARHLRDLLNVATARGAL